MTKEIKVLLFVVLIKNYKKLTYYGEAKKQKNSYTKSD